MEDTQKQSDYITSFPEPCAAIPFFLSFLFSISSPWKTPSHSKPLKSISNLLLPNYCSGCYFALYTPVQYFFGVHHFNDLCHHCCYVQGQFMLPKLMSIRYQQHQKAPSSLFLDYHAGADQITYLS